MELLNNFSSFTIAVLSSSGWANFAQGTGALLTGFAAIFAFYIGRKGINRMMLGESIKIKINEFQDANKLATKKSKVILDELIHDDTQDRPVTTSDLERYHDLAKSLHKNSYGAADVAQSNSFLAMHILDHCTKNYRQGNSLILYSRLNLFMTNITEQIFNSCSNAVIAPSHIRITAIQRPKKRFRKIIGESQAMRIEGITSGIDLRPNSSVVCRFYENLINFTDDPVYASALPYLLRSNDFIKISLEANGIYAPPILIGQGKDNLLGFKKELWLIGFKLSTQTFPEKVENVSFFYMSKNQSYKFVHQIDNLEKLTQEYADPAYNLDLRKYFAKTKFEKPKDDIIKITIPKNKCRSNGIFLFLNKKIQFRAIFRKSLV